MADIKVTVHVPDNISETVRSIKIGQLYDILKSHCNSENELDSVNKNVR